MVTLDLFSMDNVFREVVTHLRKNSGSVGCFLKSREVAENRARDQQKTKLGVSVLPLFTVE